MKNLIYGIAVAALIGSPALAADMALKAPSPPAAVSSWTGCYIGANIGGIWSRETTTWVSEIAGIAPGPVTPPQARGSLTASGFAYGGQVGCDYQFNQNWVVGIRGMWDGTTARGSVGVPIPNVGNVVGEDDNSRLESLATLTGRVGVLVNPTVMLYGVGGAAWVWDRFTTTAPGSGEVLAASYTRAGYDVGAGISWLAAPNWEFWLEYDHMGFASHTIGMVGADFVAGFIYGFNQTQNVDKILVGANWRFK